MTTPSLNHAMHLACVEARKWLGATSPNPAVGASALDAEGKIVALAAHRKAGELHAEATLIKMCREQNLLSHVHTLCVTLEPCNHYGRTPPCTETIIGSGIKHVAIGTRDPNPVASGGVERLRQNGIEVIENVNEEECRQLLASFLYFVKNGRPWITIKRAFDKDGSMIPPPGQKTFTSQESLRLAHQLRKKCDAILTGSGTILADTPLFTIREVPDFPGKKRTLAILDRRKRVGEEYFAMAHENGFEVVVYEDVKEAIEDLTKKNVRDILVEAGPSLSQTMIDSHLWEMSVIIAQDNPDRIEVKFNPQEKMPFAPAAFQWDYFLPFETAMEEL